MDECARMNCDKTAVALLTFSPPDAKAWLYDLDQPDPTGGIMLCRKHANATVVPMSWQLIDSRDPAWPGPGVTAPVEPALAPQALADIDASMPALPSDSAAIEEEFAALSANLPVTPQRYAEPQMATARAAGGSLTRGAPTHGIVATEPVTTHGDASDELIDLGGAATPDPSLFELPISDAPAVTPHPGY